MPTIHIGSIYSTPELALLVGNVFSALVNPKGKVILTLKENKQISDTTSEFIFSSNRTLPFLPRQYMEWTLPHEKTDSRGDRRYFTIASSPTEKDIRLGVKIT